MSVRILTGDCAEMLRTLPDGAFQCCVTSPPYFGLRDYGVEGQIGLEQTPDEYVAKLVEVFREVRRVLRDDGTLWLNLGDSYNAYNGNRGASRGEVNGHHHEIMPGLPGGHGLTVKSLKNKDLIGIPWRVAFALQADGWWLRSAIVWAKPNPMPESVRDRPTSAYEHVFLLAKRSAYFYDAEAIREPISPHNQGEISVPPMGAHQLAEGARRQERRAYDEIKGANARNVWTIATQPFGGAHFATMPPALAERCIRAGTSEAGACPRCGGPWARVVERTRLRDGEPISGGWPQQNARRLGATGVGHWRDTQETRTLGWRPSCACPAHAPVPQHVLDPFGGAGTTGLVADRLGRHATLIELNPEYAALARERLTADAPLLAEVA